MNDEYNPYGETPDDIFKEEMEQRYNCGKIDQRQIDQRPNKNTKTIARWHYRGLIIAQYVCAGLGIGIGMMLKSASDENAPYYAHLEKPVHLEKKDVNEDGIDDLILIDSASKNYDIFIGQKDGTYLDLDDYYSQKDKDTSERNMKEKESIEDKVKQQYKK